jgi:GNAT superfamily N-acetyltransferase
MPGDFWRPLEADDLATVEAIAAKVHPGFFERPEIFAERIALYPAGARLFEIDGVAAGYVFSHPYRLGALPALDTLLGALPPEPDCFYLHDLALLPGARGRGAGAAITGALAAHAAAQGFADMALVAVNGSKAFWQRLGFAPVEIAALRDKLLSYEPEACYMQRRL